MADDNGLSELLSFSKTGQDRKAKEKITAVVEEGIEELLWSLNENKHYEAESYGGVIEKGFHPSGVCRADCVRKLVYGYLDVEGEAEENYIDPGLRRIFDNGSDMHDRWQRYMTMLSLSNKKITLLGDWKCKGCGEPISPGKEIPPPNPKKWKCKKCKATRYKYNEFRLRHKRYRITGKRDGKLLINGEKFMVELKSMNSFQFSNLTKPVAGHIKQFSLYMFCDKEKTRKGLFIYESKNDQKIKVFLHKYNKADIADVLAVLRLANDAINAKKLPARLPTYPAAVACKGCHLRNICANKKIKFKDLS